MPRGRLASGGPKPEAKKGGKASKATRNSPRQAAVAAPEPNPDTHEGVRDLTRQQYESCLHLQAAARQQMEAGEVTAALAREMGGLSRSIVVLAAEMRQQEKFYEKRAQELGDELVAQLVLEWLAAEASPSVRQLVRDGLEEMDSSSSLLG